MSRQYQYERILDSFHASVFDDARWPATSGLIDTFCGAKGNFVVFGGEAAPDDIDIFFARFCFGGQRHAKLEREYFEVYHAMDERVPRLRRLPDSQLASVASLFSENEMKSSVVYNELLPRTGTRNGFNVRLDGPGRLAHHVGHRRPRGRGRLVVCAGSGHRAASGARYREVRERHGLPRRLSSSGSTKSCWDRSCSSSASEDGFPTRTRWKIGELVVERDFLAKAFDR